MAEYKELKSLFISDPSSAIQRSQELICSTTEFNSFKDFYNYHLENSHISTCQNEWSKPQMSIHCNDCSLDQQSCICLQCYLNGNHQGHEIVVRQDSVGNCDCGDSTLWKKSGYCSKHKGLEDNSHPEEYLDENLRNLLTDTIFKAAFSSLKHHLTDDGTKISIIFQFLISFLKFGDGFRRLLTISLTEKINFEKLFYGVIDASITFNEHFQQLCGLLVNDQVFKTNFAPVNFKIMIEKVASKEIEFTCNKEENNLRPWQSFWFHSYRPQQFQQNIDHNRWDWVSFAIKALTFIKEPFKFIGDPDFSNEIPSSITPLVDLSDCAEIQPNEETQRLLDRLFSEVLTTGTSKGVQEGINDTVIITSFNKNEGDGRYGFLFYFDYIFFEIADCFKGKKNLKFDKVFKILDATVDISQIFMPGHNVVDINENKNENDNLISKLLSKAEDQLADYRSFHNGAAFFISYPMYYMLACIIREDNLCRLKIATLLGMKKYEGLKVRLGIITLKSILALVCMHQSLIRKMNFGAIRYLWSFINNPAATNFGVPLLFPLMQMVLGVHTEESNNESSFTLKEFFAFEMAREIGLFDRLDGEEYQDEDAEGNENQMTFTFLYLSLLVVIERTLFNFDKFKYIEEQIIFALKKGVNSMNNLRQMYDKKVAMSGKQAVDINQIIAKDGAPRQKANKNGDEGGSSLTFSAGNTDVSYDLKEGVENKPISAINSFNEEKVIMNDEIKKHPNNLLHIPHFEDESTYFFKESESENNENNDDFNVKIHLKEFLMTPTVIAIVYNTLRKSDKIDLNDHLAMNVLLLISKFVTESEEPSSFDENTTIDYSNKYQLICNLKRAVFNYKEGSESSITNTLNRKSFEALLKVKFTLNGSDGKSFIDIIAAKGEVGKKVLAEMAVETGAEGGDGSNKEDQISKQKKMKAQKMKEEIMSHFKNMTYSFNSVDLQSASAEDLLSPTPSCERETCSICSMPKRNEVLSYPLYIYRTKFPFIVDKPPHVSMLASEAIGETEVFEDNEIENETETQEEEDNIPDFPDIDEILAGFIVNNPELNADEEGITDEEKQRRTAILGIFRQQIAEQIQTQIAVYLRGREERKQSRLIRQQKKKDAEEEIEKLKSNPNQIVVRQVTPGNLFVIQFGICQHLVHHTCVGEDDFTCPIDRSFRNGFLPNIADLPPSAIFVGDNKEVTCENLSENLKAALDFFIDKFSLFFVSSNDKLVDVFVELIKSLSGVIATYEVRLRNLPDCLDSNKNLILARNLFLTAWYSYRMRNKPQLKTGFKGDRESEDVDKRLTLFQRFIRRLLECDEIESTFEKKEKSLKSIVQSFIKEENDKYNLFLFLRRVSLADHFLLMRDEDSLEETPFIDWDELLSSEFISEKFNVDLSSIEGFEFPPFRFTDLPKDFLRFGAPPFCFPVDKTHECSMFNILDYNYMIKNYSDIDADKKNVSDDDLLAKNQNQLVRLNGEDLNTFLHVHFSSLNYPSILLFIGGMSTMVIVVDGRRVVGMRPFYVDKYGSADVGFNRNQQVFLNDERYERVIDEILSGDFSNKLEEF